MCLLIFKKRLLFKDFLNNRCLLYIWYLILSVAIFGCGIYTNEGALNPPFGLNKTTTTLIFSGYNLEVYFSGYRLWYKELDDPEYSVCEYKGKIELPTIPRIDEMDPGLVVINNYLDDLESPRIEYFVNISDLAPLDSEKNFTELIGEGKNYLFAVSAYGKNGEESEKIPFSL